MEQHNPADKALLLSDTEKCARIQELNDLLRMTFAGGKVMMTDGIGSLPIDTQQAILHMVQAFDSFTPDNDPYGEHDFGAIECEERKVLWKIDYYDKDLTYGSVAPWDASQTTRVLTIMLAEEW